MSNTLKWIIELAERKDVKISDHGYDELAEVEIELIDTDEGWSPYLSMDDAFKLDDVRDALRRGDLRKAGGYSMAGIFSKEFC